MQYQRYFNTEGQCIPKQHYMVPLDDRIRKIRERFVDRGKYFVINKGRQYGKTTTLLALAEYLKEDYHVLFMDFQDIGTEEFQDVAVFVHAFASLIQKNGKVPAALTEATKDFSGSSLRELFDWLSKMCAAADKPVVLIVDEADSASNNQIFIDFLAMLRRHYIDRENNPTFYSVILAGVYDIKNLKLKLRPDEEHRYNSPWNIAARFNIDMNFTAVQIAQMLKEYEVDRQTGMDIDAAAACIYAYTNGYPYLVSAICKFADEEIPEQISRLAHAQAWSKEGIAEAVRLLLNENIPLFDSMVKQLDTYQNLRTMMQEILYQGRRILFSPAEKSIQLGLMFGFLKEENGCAVIANRIFEMYLLNLFLSEESVGSEMYFYGQGNRNQFVTGRRLDMELVLKKFAEHFTEIYGQSDEKFVESCGRRLFLLYLKPIINGTGNYYLEAQTRDAKRTDVIVDYLGEQFIVELKIWHGNEYQERGRQQLMEYLDYYKQDKGYLLSFNFNKKKETGVKKLQIGEKLIIEAVV